MKKLIKLTVLAFTTITIMACNNNGGGAPSSPEPLISAAESETFTETGSIPADLTDGNWTYQEIKTSTRMNPIMNTDDYTVFIASLTEEEFALLNVTQTATGYEVIVPIDKSIDSDIYNITKSGNTYTLTSRSYTGEVTITNTVTKSIINKYLALYNQYNESISWNGNTGISLIEMNSEYCESYDTAYLISSASYVPWKTNNDKTKFYAKITQNSYTTVEYIIVKK